MCKHLYHYYILKRSKLFDSAYYLLSNPDVRKADVDPLMHYIKHGWKEGRNPSVKFNTNIYMNLYSDVKKEEINPLYHYVKFGKKENRNISQNITIESNKSTQENIRQVKDGYIFVSHNASLTGAPINLLQMCKAYKQFFGNNFLIFTFTGGELLQEFNEVGQTINLEQHICRVVYDKHLYDLFLNLFKLGYRKCIANTIISASLIKILNNIGFDSLFAIHELPEAIERLEAEEIAQELSMSNNDVVFAAKFVANKFQKAYGLPDDKIHIVPQGIRDSLIFRGERENARIKLLNKIGLKNHENIKIILSVGFSHKAKGTDLFIEVVKILYDMKKLNNLHFIWLGNRDEEFELIIKDINEHQPYASNIHFLEFEFDPAFIYAAADLYLLTSRADSFPSAALEALANHTPVIMFKDTSGIEELLDGKNGKAVSTLDTHEMALEILKRVEHDRTRITAKINTYETYISKLVSIIENSNSHFKQTHKVSVVIPNYNYEQFLDERINSIINQRYQPSEIIFLDDASTDQSIKKAEKLLSKTDIPYKIITNSENQGVYKQWLRGISESQFDYIWIAEADDKASEDFLSVLMKGFNGHDVVISYCQSDLIDERSEIFSDYSYQNYVADLSETKWLQSYVENGSFEVINYLAIRNTIPNASSVVIKKSALQGIDNILKKFKYAGDWYAYIHALLQGNIFYSSMKLNSFRRHQKSQIASGGGNEIFLDEVQSVYSFIMKKFLLNNSIISKMQNNFNIEAGTTSSGKALSDYFNNAKQLIQQKIRRINRLNILIVLSEFNIGGGEITGLRLANHLSKEHDVFLYNAKQISNPNFLKMIDAKVKIVPDKNQLFSLLHSGILNFINSHIWWGDKFIYQYLKDNSIFWILSMHGCYEMLLSNPNADIEFSELSKEIIQRADFITYDAEKNLAILKSIFDNNIFSKTKKIYHGFSPEIHNEGLNKSELGFSNESFVFTFVARGIKEKGWQEVIDVAELLKNAQFDIGIILIGDSSYVDSLRQEYHQHSFMKFVGEQHNLQKYLSITNCGLLPTYFVSESQPLIIIEYLAAGIPIIASDIGEIKSMVTMDESIAGKILPLINGKVDTNQLFNAMKEIIENQEFYELLKNSSTIIFESKFSIEKFAEAYLSIYYDQQ